MGFGIVIDTGIGIDKSIVIGSGNANFKGICKDKGKSIKERRR